jgi:D-alanyl-lipoteichoic acid acyltransferase DltB (MBOAT superfamily)
MRQEIFSNTGVGLLYAFLYVFSVTILIRFRHTHRLFGVIFLAINLTFVWAAFFSTNWEKPWIGEPRVLLQFFLYILFGFVHFLLIRIFQNRRAALFYNVALWFPILILVVAKIETTWQFVGLSYMSFRMAGTAMEVRKNKDLSVGLANYIGFLFFLPTLSIGPISPFTMHLTGLATAAVSKVTVLRGLARIAIGLLLYKLVAPIPQQLSFANLWTDGYTHDAIDFLISSYAYLAYLFCNFAGATHIVIGVAALVGIPVKENFNNPHLARNIKDFWNRWHITLSEFVRDLIFTPVTLLMMRVTGPKFAVPVTILAAMLTFLVIGLWHGQQTGFVIFGLLHGLGFSIHFLFESAMKRLRYHRHPVFKARLWVFAARSLTLTYIALTTVFVEYPDFVKLKSVVGAFVM